MKPGYILILLLLSGCLNLACSDKTSTNSPKKISVKQTQNKTTRLKSWFLNDGGFFLELTQRLPDQNRAFFQSQGFDEKLSDILGTSCIFKTVIQNKHTAASTNIVTVDLGKWKIVQNKKTRPMQTRERWADVFIQQHKVPKTRALVLRWALYPTVNNINPGDYNWGMSSFGLKPGSKFDLIVHWSVKGKDYQHTIKNMGCPPDKDRL
jgi:hypothetical protein